MEQLCLGWFGSIGMEMIVVEIDDDWNYDISRRELFCQWYLLTPKVLGTGKQ